MIEVVPSILVATKEEFEALVRKLEPVTNRVHLDILDGIFTSTQKTISGYEEVLALDTRPNGSSGRAKLQFDVHLMVAHPQELMAQWFKTKVDRIFIQAEAQGDIKELLLEIKCQGRKAGLSLNPETSVDTITECLPMLDYVQFMTIHPGAYGRPFLADTVDKILNFHDLYPDITIAVDGGMNPQTARLVRNAGASIIISGSYVEKSSDMVKAIAELKGEII